MGLKTHDLDLVEQVQQIDTELEEVGKEKKSILQDSTEYKQEHGEDATLPENLKDKWTDVDNREVELKGERQKFIEAILCYSSDTDITEKRPSQCTGSEQSISNVDDLDEHLKDVDSCVFVVEELTFGQIQSVSDEMMEESFEVDVEREKLDGTPQQGFYQIKLLQEAILQWPTHAPTVEGSYGAELPSPGDYPIPVGEWLFEKVDALNTRGDTSMGNSSLEEAMNLQN